ncbi:MAG: hypothetical protein NZ609_12945 [Acidimicrobiales bacterium]|nr:hypothetical protein [Acidimicrobiales bacterium]
MRRCGIALAEIWANGRSCLAQRNLGGEGPAGRKADMRHGGIASAALGKQPPFMRAVAKP